MNISIIIFIWGELMGLGLDIKKNDTPSIIETMLHL